MALGPLFYFPTNLLDFHSGTPFFSPESVLLALYYNFIVGMLFFQTETTVSISLLITIHSINTITQASHLLLL